MFFLKPAELGLVFFVACLWRGGQVGSGRSRSLWVRLAELQESQDKVRKSDDPIPVRLPASTPLFRIPSGLTCVFDRDLSAAGIAKRDERIRVVNVHALPADGDAVGAALGLALHAVNLLAAFPQPVVPSYQKKPET